MFFVYIMGFSGMPYIGFLSENILDIALLVNNSRWPPFVQSQAINSYNFRSNIGRFVFCFDVYHWVFWYAVHSSAVRKYVIHCIVSKKSKMATICKGQLINGHHSCEKSIIDTE